MVIYKVSQFPSIKKLLSSSVHARSHTTRSTFQQWRATSNNKMSTHNKIQLTVNDTGVVKNRPQTQETATRTSELLQENHDKHHIFFNSSGFHNHIAHHLLTLYGLGAPLSAIEQGFKNNASYQRPATSSPEVSVQDMRDPETFAKYLGKEKYYRSYLLFFQAEIGARGWEDVLQQYIFAGSNKADDMLGRLFAGFLHPIIHLGFGIEFHQPSIIAEALAQASVHENWLNQFFFNTEAAQKTSSSADAKRLVPLLHEIHADPKLSTAAEWADGNKIRDGILARAPEEMIKYASQWTVTPETLQKKTHEMINTAIYYAAAAQHPPKQVKFDFYFIHCVNSSIFWSTFNKLEWLSTENKVRLLKWKGWLDLAMYASRRSPPLLKEAITDYLPANPFKATWPDIFDRLFEFNDDGHAIKLSRAVRHGQMLAGDAGKGAEGLEVSGDMWEKIGNMAVDSVEDSGATWARSVGFEEAWAEYDDAKPRPQL